ncbi:MAG: FAD-dependent tricarballylate dehydrogenase TcuA [Chloroflexi bacterium]|nr:FAD-dependent tricarballylate dehydrogenase TcuA [Chloroflexota bacterium]
MLVKEAQIPEEQVDVVVLGTGLGGLAAALSAHERNARVVILEKAPPEARGGNTRFSGGAFRAVTEVYDADAFFADIMKVTHSRANRDLATTMVLESTDSVQWLQDLGVRFEPAERVRPDARGPFFGFAYGGGMGAIETLIPIAEKRGIPIHYETAGERLLLDGRRRVVGVRALGEQGYRDFRAKAVVIATGGFQANTEWRVRYIGRFADELVVRGTRFNTGDGLRMALDIGAQSAGQWGDFHSAIIDARSPALEAGETNINTYPFGIIVNREGRRFLDEGEDFQADTYVKFGKTILELPGRTAFLIFDTKVKESGLMVALHQEFQPYRANTIRELAAASGIDVDGLERTVQDYNAAIQPGEFNSYTLDGKGTVGIIPPKSNWALPVEQPPFYAYPVTGGITFTFGGLKVNTKAQVVDQRGKAIPGLYAAGEIIGEIFYYNYPGGSSLTRCVVFGRIAGQHAAKEQG